MPAIHAHTPHRPQQDVPDPDEPDPLPVEPDQGPVPAHIPADAEHDRMIDPQAPSSDVAGRG